MTSPVTTTWGFDVHESYTLNANNASGHWAKNSEGKEVLRNLGVTHGRIHKIPRFQRVRMDVVVSYPTRRVQDVMNLYPSMKAYVDGMVNGRPQYAIAAGPGGIPKKKRLAPPVEFGILPDDNDVFLSGPHLEWSGRLSSRPGHFRFEVTLTELPPLELDPAAVAPSILKRHPELLEISLQPASGD